jgi:hypothetical protein
MAVAGAGDAVVHAVAEEAVVTRNGVVRDRAAEQVARAARSRIADVGGAEVAVVAVGVGVAVWNRLAGLDDIAAPERLAGVMMTGFALKAVFFGVYVVVMLRVMMLRPVPFVVSFTAYFITLYAMEALLLRRLLRS